VRGAAGSKALLQAKLSADFLTGSQACKFKKPIKLDFVGYSTLARRNAEGPPCLRTEEFLAFGGKRKRPLRTG